MDVYLALDALLAFIIFLFIPIGLWRGAARESMVAAGILLGAALAGAWARPWGDDLAARTAFEPPTARFAVATAALVLCTVGLGYGGGVVWRGEPPGPFGRLVGGLLAGLNGVLLLGFTLSFLDRYLLEGDTSGAIADGRVARVLLDQFGWLLLGAAAALFGVVVVGFLFNLIQGGNRRTPPFPNVEPRYAAAGNSRTRPPRVPMQSDSGKAEPLWREADPAERFVPNAPTWEPIEPRPYDVGGDQRLEGGRGEGAGTSVERYPYQRDQLSAGSGGPSSGQALASDWLRRTAAMSRPSESNSTASERSGTGAGSPYGRPALPLDRSTGGGSSFSIVDLGEVRRSQRGQWGQDRSATPQSADPTETGRLHRWNTSQPNEQETGRPTANDEVVGHTGRSCRTCSAPLSPTDTFCTDCGAPV